jgi:hypothetical protein
VGYPYDLRQSFYKGQGLQLGANDRGKMTVHHMQRQGQGQLANNRTNPNLNPDPENRSISNPNPSLEDSQRDRLGSREYQQHQLALSSKQPLVSESIAFSLNIALPRSPFQLNSVSYGETFNTTTANASELALRTRSQSISGSLGDNGNDLMILGQGRGRERSSGKERGEERREDMRLGVGNGSDRQETFFFQEDDGDEDEEEEEEEEEEDMPFAWTQSEHSMIFANTGSEKTKQDDKLSFTPDEDSLPVGDNIWDGRPGPANPNLNPNPSQQSSSPSTKNLNFACNIPPSLLRLG